MFSSMSMREGFYYQSLLPPRLLIIASINKHMNKSIQQDERVQKALQDAVKVDITEQRDVFLFFEDNVLLPSSSLTPGYFEKLVTLMSHGLCCYIDKEGHVCDYATFMEMEREKEVERLGNLDKLPQEEQLAVYTRAGLTREDLILFSDLTAQSRGAIEKSQGKRIPPNTFLVKAAAIEKFGSYCATVMNGGKETKVTISKKNTSAAVAIKSEPSS
jgi:hypothetical protein